MARKAKGPRKKCFKSTHCPCRRRNGRFVKCGSKR